MLRAAVYLRYSSDRQDCATIETQRNECLVKAKALGAVVVSEFIDEAQTGTDDKRDAFQRMLLEAKRKPRPWDFVIVRKLDRLARHQIEARLTEEALEKHGVKLVSVYEDFDTSTPMGWMSRQLIHIINEWYSKNLATETIAGQITNTKRGFRSAGSAPFGYENERVNDVETGKVRTKLKINEREAETIRLIFKRYSEGNGYNKIISELDALGMKPRKALIWNKSNLSQFLSNETYNGVLFFRNHPDPAKWTRNPGGAPRIIDEETWGKVQTRVETNRKPKNIKIEASAHPLAGLIFCEECEGRFTTGQKNGGRWKLVCSNHRYNKGCSNPRTVDEAELVEAIKEILLNKIFTRENMALALEQLKGQIIDTTVDQAKDLAKIRRRITDNEAKQAKLVDELTSGDLPREAIRKGLLKLEDEKKSLIAQVESVEKEIEQATQVKVTGQDLEEFCSIAHCQIRDAEGETLKRYFQRFMVKVTVGLKDGRIAINPAIFGRVDAGTSSAWSGALNVPALSAKFKLRIAPKFSTFVNT